MVGWWRASRERARTAVMCEYTWAGGPAPGLSDGWKANLESDGIRCGCLRPWREEVSPSPVDGLFADGLQTNIPPVVTAGGKGGMGKPGGARVLFPHNPTFDMKEGGMGRKGLSAALPPKAS
ncbi:hypothetical protein EAI_12054 [Harpegnathos saltator]|uniref:Uncharacterized protein n=1 Tax=Harpegnathos saltator TaxID=610380 RepID=E2B462_HARSA|nr:hypothetical protein EAI_12054 [Harpegnathos saltator]